jgi:hypothetical protein
MAGSNIPRKVTTLLGILYTSQVFEQLGYCTFINIAFKTMLPRVFGKFVQKRKCEAPSKGQVHIKFKNWILK